jgi:hypothetical protein
MSRKKLHRDRQAGLHFHWHLPHGSLGRLLIGGLVATLFWGALMAYVQVRVPDPLPLPQRAGDLEIVDLEHPANRWLSEVVERESPFHSRWEVRDDSRLNREIADALKRSAPSPYQPTLQIIDLSVSAPELRGLPGVSSHRLPAPEAVTIAAIPTSNPEWWIEVSNREAQSKWGGTSFRWTGENAALSPGETWTFQLIVDWRGIVVSCLPLEGLKENTALELAKTLRELRYPLAKKDAPLRRWMLDASCTERSVP